MPKQGEAKPRRPVNFGAGVLAQAEADTEHGSYLGKKVIGRAATMLLALAYALYEHLLAPFVAR